jgi:hypothetical protein
LLGKVEELLDCCRNEGGSGFYAGAAHGFLESDELRFGTTECDRFESHDSYNLTGGHRIASSVVCVAANCWIAGTYRLSVLRLITIDRKKWVLYDAYGYENCTQYHSVHL